MPQNQKENRKNSSQILSMASYKASSMYSSLLMSNASKTIGKQEEFTTHIVHSHI
jgi:hypothetical protein